MERQELVQLVFHPLSYIGNLPDAEGSWLRSQIDSFWETHSEDEFEHSDCFRLARMDIEDEQVEFENTASCCGSCETVFGPSPQGVFYTWGFNYGH